MILSIQLLLLASITSCSVDVQQMNSSLSLHNLSSMPSRSSGTRIISTSENSPIQLRYNWFMDGSGQWVDQSTTYTWDNDWGTYNCYSYAIQRFDEIPDCYVTSYWPQYTSSIRWYEPGRFSNTPNNYEYSGDYVASAVESDLYTIGYTDIAYVQANSYDVDILENGQELIALRTGGDDEEERDFHFMRYCQDDGFWYHKPGGTAVLRYKYDVNFGRPWQREFISETRWISTEDIRYDENIYFFTYYPKVINPIAGSGNSTASIVTSNTHDVVMWMNVDSDGMISLDVSGMNGGMTKLYDSRWHEIEAFSYGTNLELTAGKYYITIMGTRYDGDTATVSAHHHTNQTPSSNLCSTCGQNIHEYGHNLSYQWKTARTHKVTCSCGLSTSQPHTVIRQGLINQLIQDDAVAASFRGTCIYCGGTALTAMGEIDNTVYIDSAEELELLVSIEGS